MQVDLFKALKSINIDDDASTSVVKALESYVAMQISHAIQPVLAGLEGLKSELAGTRAELSSQISAMSHIQTEAQRAKESRATLVRWVIGTSITAVAATLGALKAIGWI